MLSDIGKQLDQVQDYNPLADAHARASDRKGSPVVIEEFNELYFDDDS
jgi:hypothetical protein